MGKNILFEEIYTPSAICILSAFQSNIKKVHSYTQCCGPGSGTFGAPISGSLKSKTLTKIIRKSYLNFLREDTFC